MVGEVSHDPAEERPEAKAAWFRSLSMEERMELLCEITNLALEINPSIQDKRDDGPPSGSVQTLSRT
jgi:hypothetical protein